MVRLCEALELLVQGEPPQVKKAGRDKNYYNMLAMAKLEELKKEGSFTDAELAELILSSNTDWNARPCPSFVAHYQDKKDWQGEGKARLLGWIGRQRGIGKET